MSENQNCGINVFENYDSMTTEELEEILRLDAEMPEGQESDTEKILYIMEVLAERKRNTSHTGKTALEAFESFKQNYMPETDNTAPVKVKCRCPRWVRSFAATAAVLAILLVGSSITAKAFGFNLWKTVIQWTQETFHFGEWGNPNANSSSSYDSLQEAMEKCNTPVWLAPTHIPEGFTLKDITVEQTPLKNTYKAKYKRGENTFIITVQDHLGKNPVYVEQSEGLVEEYNISGITYYLFENNEQVQTIWIVDSYECCIAGRVTVDELKRMINSIEKG